MIYLFITAVYLLYNFMAYVIYVCIWRQTVTEILRYIDFYNMAAICHLGFAGRVFRPHTDSTRQSLSLYKVWLQSVQ